MTTKAAAAKEVTRLRDLKLSARDQFIFDPQSIHIEQGHNPRNYKLPENRAHLDELKISIKDQGVLVPILVRYDAGERVAVLVDGECRLRAVLELIAEGAEIPGIPAIQVPGTNEIERLVIALTANTGKPLSKWESGAAFTRLIRFGMEIPTIAKKLGYTERFVKESMELTDAPEEIKVLLSESAVTPSLALYHIRKSGTGAVMTLRSKVNEAKSKGKKTATLNRTSNLLKLVQKLLADVEKSTLENTEFKFVEVDRRKLKAIYGFLNPE
jgi:ParB/RepB/Spo0J family partition protein